ncbi:AI-2E family transporter [Govanella unica]|uniref:AI-2E family transporter n=1 Tax=Govanella unica TaxID=2975056 RepID=A0A9X3TVL6_9PROT|nr:AI-2E family transporter [Govania unica]MDA5192522.1 AI-2E family transporter [Govania unica]
MPRMPDGPEQTPEAAPVSVGRHLDILTHSIIFIAVVLAGYVLAVGRDLFVPFAIALLIWILISALASVIGRVPFSGRRLPRGVSIVLALVIIALGLGITVEMIIQSMGSMGEAAKGYSENARNMISIIFDRLNIPEPRNLSDMAKQIDIGASLGIVAGGLSAFAETFGLVFIYAIFLLASERAWKQKFHVLVPDTEKRERMATLITRVREEVQAYLWLRSLISLAAAVTSYLVLISVGFKFAGFWALLIFLFNFIPTIGPIVGVVGPSLFALLQFGVTVNFVIVAAGLSFTQFVLDNVVSPRIQGARLGLDPVVLLLALVGWGMMWGLAGMFLSVPLTVIAMIVFSHFPRTRPLAILLSEKGDLK